MATAKEQGRSKWLAKIKYMYRVLENAWDTGSYDEEFYEVYYEFENMFYKALDTFIQEHGIDAQIVYDILEKEEESMPVLGLTGAQIRWKIGGLRGKARRFAKSKWVNRLLDLHKAVQARKDYGWLPSLSPLG